MSRCRMVAVIETFYHCLHQTLMICTFIVIGLLAVPMLLSLCLIAVVWCIADPVLIRLERRSQKRLTA